MAETLMGLIRNCRVDSRGKSVEELREGHDLLKEIGFSDIACRLALVAAYRYKRITDEAIEEFLDAKSERTGESYEWEEVDISEYYEDMPPKAVLLAAKKAKDRGVFDSLTVASVYAVKDPLLLGRIEGVSNRFFIAQWGTDVQLDDLI